MKKRLFIKVAIWGTILGIFGLLVFMACSSEGGDCTITFDLGYETSKEPPAPITVKSGKAIGALPRPERPTWYFSGWKDENGKTVTRDNKIKGDVILTATWHFEPGLTNPIFRDRYTSDPAPIVEGDTLYIFTGEDYIPQGGRDFYTMPRWHIYSTTDMKEFKYEGKVLDAEDFEFAKENSAWAAQAIKGKNGKFYFYGTIELRDRSSFGSGYALCVAVADEITGPYEPVQTPIVNPNMVRQDVGDRGWTDIDPTVLIDDDGKAYICWGKDDKPIIAELDTDMGSNGYMTTIKRPMKFLFQEGYYGDHVLAEGPWLDKRNGWYYCIYPSFPRREDGTINSAVEHMAYSRARSIDGPWEFGGALGGAAPGSFTIHPGIVDFQGMTYIFHHNGRLNMTLEDGRNITGGSYWRAVCVDYLYYDEETGHFEAIDTNNPAGISVPPRDQ